MPYGEGHAIVDLRGNILHESWAAVDSRSILVIWMMVHRCTFLANQCTFLANQAERQLWVQCRLSVQLLYPCDAMDGFCLGLIFERKRKKAIRNGMC